MVVGAGPGGSATATFLARQGLDVLVIEKERFPREKVCGDGLTPRAVAALDSLGLHAEAQGEPPGWARQEGLRMYGGGITWNLPWPETSRFPSHSVTATRALFDTTLARHAEKEGAVLWEGTKATAPVWLSTGEDRLAGVAYERDDGTRGTVRARTVVLADGGSSRVALALGLHRDERRPMGAAIRAYYRSPRAAMDHMEGFLELRKGAELLPGYGWIFPLDDGLVNVGWGLISTSRHFQTTSYRTVLDHWVSGFPAEWGMGRDTMVGTPKGAGLPMAHNRHPHVVKGAVLVGDSAGMVNPFNGEGISYAIEASGMAADAIARAHRSGLESDLRRYPRALAAEWGGYFTLGRLFLEVMGNPVVMQLCTRYGMPRRRLMEFVFRTMAHLVEPDSRRLTDVLVTTLARVVPAA